MKKTKITLIIGCLLLLSSNLFAQNAEGRFGLKEGDWFEMEAELIFRTTLQMNNRGQNEVNEITLLLNYQLQKQLQNGNQLYRIQLDHYKIKKRFSQNYMGIDSYYPPFEENKRFQERKNQYSLEVTPSGKVARFTAFGFNKSGIAFSTIKSLYSTNNQYLYKEEMQDSWWISEFSKLLMVSDTLSNKEKHTLKNGVPFFIRTPDIRLTLSGASFPLPGNTIIEGVAKDQIKKEIRISDLGAYSENGFIEKEFRTDTDGSFTCPVFLNRPYHLRITIGNKTFTTFLEPGDTLHFSEIAYLAHQLAPPSSYSPLQEEYLAEGMKGSYHFSGKAEYNTILSNQINRYQNYPLFDKGNQSKITISKEVDRAVNDLIKSYHGRASDICLDYFRRDWNYFLAYERLRLYEDSRIVSGYKTNKGVPNMNDYPADFFLGVDTIPILMNPFEWNTSYQIFIGSSQQFKQSRLGWAVGNSNFQNFNERYSFTMASLRGYPLYSQIASLINLELRHNPSNFDVIEPRYQAFINNCSDPALTEPLIKVHKTTVQLKIGNKFPLNELVLADSSVFHFDRFKGKSICLILINSTHPTIQEFNEVISKFTSYDVQFILANLPDARWTKGKPDSILTKLANVTYLELADENLKWSLQIRRNRIFMMDKWFRIVENNAEDPVSNTYQGSMSEFEKSIRKTIETKRYTKAEKTAAAIIATWSLVSILFTFLIGLWVYRVRVRRIKKQEAARRRIKEIEIKAIRSQMNPHFIFNALNSIQSLINGNQFKEANIYLSKFAVLLRGVLNNSEKSCISLSDELQAVELYCQLEQLRFEFKFEISIDQEVNCDLIEIPGMIIQPLAENAVVHGLSGKGDQGKLNIHVKRQNGNLCICVSDNGIGLPTEITDTLSQKGFGLKLVEERINILNLDGKEAKLTVENRSNTAGTVATLIIPID